jgi:N-acyl-D-aspartate/D-glutamate deacylase
MKTKGRLRTGADADIAIVDAATVIDRSTYREPALPPIGIRHVLVNGVAVVAKGQAVDGVTPGQPVRAGDPPLTAAARRDSSQGTDPSVSSTPRLQELASRFDRES